MGLPASQQRVLERIEDRLKESDPRLAALFGIFSRLSHEETMPWAEHIKVRPVIDSLARMVYLIRTFPSRPVARARTLLIAPAALTALICGLAIAIGFPGPQRNATTTKPQTARELVIKPRCRLTMFRVPLYAAC